MNIKGVRLATPTTQIIYNYKDLTCGNMSTAKIERMIRLFRHRPDLSGICNLQCILSSEWEETKFKFSVF